MPDLTRFVEAQATTYEQSSAELRSGQKRSHWMWFIFPQIHGLGRSPTAVRYAIASLEEARAYLAHPILGPRLLASTVILLSLHGRSAEQIFGSPDDLKLHSSLTLFDLAAPGGVFHEALERYFAGRRDPNTLRQVASVPADDGASR